MTYVGIRELKAQLSKYVRSVRRGEEIVITDHGKPVARLVNGFGKDRSVGEKLVKLAHEGSLILPTKLWKPRGKALVHSKGRPASDIIMEDRR